MDMNQLKDPSENYLINNMYITYVHVTHKLITNIISYVGYFII